MAPIFSSMTGWPASSAAVSAMSTLAQYGAMAMTVLNGVWPEEMIPCTQLRLALAGDYDMRISWNTDDRQKSKIKWGSDPSNLNRWAYGESVTYPTSTTWSNHVKLEGLKPDSTYFYKIKGDHSIRNFTTAPAKGSDDEWAFAFVADLGTMGPLGLSDHGDGGAGWALEPGEQTTIDSMVQKIDDYKFVWHDGDLAYADSWLREELDGYLPNKTVDDGVELYETILNAFYEQVASISRNRPYMVGPGNHEASCNNGGSGDYDDSICVEGQNNFTGYQSHFRMPNDESKGKLNMWYSFDYGNVHFVQLNTETDLGKHRQGPDEPGGEQETFAGPFGDKKNEQIKWLKKDLKNVDRRKTPWVIVAGHRPWYASLKERNLCTDCQDAFEKILQKNKVDLVLFGHVHNYQRLDPIYKGKVDKRGLDNPKHPWYILNGAGGHYDGLDGLNTKHAPDGYITGFDDTYGWSRITVHNNTHLTHEFIASTNNTVLDSATLYKKHKKFLRSKDYTDEEHDDDDDYDDDDFYDEDDYELWSEDDDDNKW